MYDFLKEAAGLDSKDELLIKAMLDDDEVQIDENDPWWETEEECEDGDYEEEEDEDSEPYEWIWDKEFPVLRFHPIEEDIDWDCVTPNEFHNIENYVSKIENILAINFPSRIYNTDLSDLFFYIEEDNDGVVTITVDKSILIDYLIDEC